MGRGHSGDAVPVRLDVDLDVVRVLDVLHETPGRAEAGLARGADVIAWFCVGDRWAAAHGKREAEGDGD